VVRFTGLAAIYSIRGLHFFYPTLGVLIWRTRWLCAKISEKGFACKTFEGELVLVTIPGTQAEKFFFTAKNKVIYETINETIGQRVRLKYKQHKWIPSSCFGDTEYFVYAIEPLEPQSFNGQ